MLIRGICILETGEVFAIKVLKKDDLVEDEDVEIVMTEKRVLMAGMAHPFLTKLYSTFQTVVCARVSFPPCRPCNCFYVDWASIQGRIEHFVSPVHSDGPAYGIKTRRYCRAGADNVKGIR